MQTIGSRDQFRREAQSMLQNIEQQLNDLSQAGQGTNKSVSADTSTEINRLKNQHKNLKEALEKYGSVNEDKWSQVQSEVQSVFDEAHSSWEQYRTNPSAVSSWGNPSPNSMQDNEEDKYQVSTGQSDRGDAGQMTGMGDRSGMEDNQGRSRAYDDSDTVNNQNGQNKQYQQKDQLLGSEEYDKDENIDEEGGVVGQERGISN